MAEYRDLEYSALSTEELESLLRVELEKDDPAAALQILDVLAQREPEDQEAAEAAWQTFQTDYLPTADERSLYEEEPLAQVRRKRPLARTAAVAAVVAAAVGMLATQAGGANPLTAFARWTTERFSFSQTNLIEEKALYDAPGRESVPAAANASVEMLEPEEETYETFQAAVDGMGLQGALVPTWLPEGYVLESAEIKRLMSNSLLQIYYTAADGEPFIRFRYSRFEGTEGGAAVVHEKDDTPVEVYERDGISYYFLSNGEFQSVTWMLDDVTECTIGGKVSQEELRKIVDSMYEAEE